MELLGARLEAGRQWEPLQVRHVVWTWMVAQESGYLRQSYYILISKDIPGIRNDLPHS